MSAASEKIKEYLKKYETSDRWIDPNTGKKLPLNKQGTTQTIINTPGSSGQSHKYVLFEDTRENGYGYLLILFKIDKETDDLAGSDPVSLEVYKPFSGPEPYVSTKQGIDYANSKRSEAQKIIDKQSQNTQDSATGTIEGYDPDNTTGVPSEDPTAQEGSKGKFMSGFFPPEGWTGFEDFYAQLREYGIDLPKYGEDYKFGTEHLDAWKRLQKILNKPENRDHKWTDQQVLMSALPDLLQHAGDYFSENSDKPKYYIVTTDSDVIDSPVQKLGRLSPDDLATILEATPLEMASLVPKIQLWKVYYDETGAITDEIYIPHGQDSRNLISDIYNNRESRGDDVGITDVSLTYDAQNPATAERLLGCNIRFLFQNAETLVTDRGEGFRYADLFAWDQTESSNQIDRDKYDIILKVGYDVDSPIETCPRRLREALSTQEQMYKLGMIGYDIAFQANGALDIGVEYSLANMEYFSDNRSEILGVTALSAAEPSENPEQSDPSTTKKEIDKLSLYNRIATYMVKKDMIHTYVVTEYSFEQGSSNEQDKTNDYEEDAATEAAKDATAPPVPDMDKRTIQYFYYGDLLDAVMGTNIDIYTELEIRNFAIVLDNAGYQFLKGQPISVFNISKMPIAVESYNEWWQHSIIKKDIKIYSLMSFLKNAVQNFAAAILKTKCPGQLGSDYSPHLNRQVVQVPDGLEDIEQSSGKTTLQTKEGITFYAKSYKAYNEYYAVYDEELYKDRMSSFMEEIRDKDRYEANINNGIPHFYIGADRGLLKEFSFQKADMGGQIAIIRNFQESNVFQQLWSIFNVDMEFIGNNLMKVGQMIYLDPTVTGLGSPFTENSVANIMGLGGYYLVQYVSHSYYPEWTTRVNATVITPAGQKPYSTDAEFKYF